MNTKMRRIASAILVAPLGLSATAFAAEEVDVQEVIVTGTSIRGVAGAGSERVSIDRTELIESGLSSSTEITRSLPQVINLGADEGRRGGAQDAAANRTATSGINLRGLSTEATLMLVNGHRVAANGTIKALNDPSVIPSIVLERLEVVPDGSSAIYGADAVAGVVNLITRKSFNGAETVARYGHADGRDNFQVAQLFSRKWSSGGFLFAYERTHSDNLAASERDFLSSDLRSRGGPDLRSTIAAPGNITVGTPAVRYILPNGTGKGLTPAQLVLATANTVNRFDQGLYGDILPEQGRNNFFLTASQEITERLEINYEGYYSKRDFYEYVTPAGQAVTVANTNPFFVHPTNPAATTVSVEYRFLDANGGASWSGHDYSLHNTLGATYKLWGDWQAQGYVSYNQNDGRARTQDLLNTIYLPIAAADSNPLTALNPFGNGALANNNPETLRRIQGLRDSSTINTGRDAVLKLDGSLFTMPGGEAKLAVGAEEHESKLKYVILSSIKNPNNDLLLDRRRDRKRTNHAFFAEAYVPLVGNDNAFTGVQALNLQLAARYEKYSDFGDTTNPKVGITWKPFDALTVRSSWGTSFRAPSLLDASDAVRNVFIQNFTDTTGAQIRGFFINGGDPTLKAEEATTWSLGADWEPEFAPGFSTSLTYYNIKYENIIDVVGPTTSIANPSIYGFLIQRNPSLALVQSLLDSPNLESVREPAANIAIIVDGARHNLGRINQDGLDFEASYRMDSRFGAWRVGTAVTKILNQERSVIAGTPFLDVLDFINFPVSVRIRSNAGWSFKGLSANLFWNHVGSYTNNLITPFFEVGSYDSFDANLGYAIPAQSGLLSGTRVSLSATNITDKEPPYVGVNGTSGYDSQNASVIGRVVSLELTKSW